MVFTGFPDGSISKGFSRVDIRPRDESPALSIMRDVFVLPELDALYTAQGHRIEISKRVTVPGDIERAASAREHVEQGMGRYAPLTINVPFEYDVIDDLVMFIGAAWPHYGHFITDAMSRLWALDQTSLDTPLLFLNRANPHYGSESYSKLVVDTLGLCDRLFGVERPTLLRKVMLPEPAIQHAFRIYHAQCIPHAKVARSLSPAYTGAFKRRPVYLTRSALKMGLRQSSAEKEIETSLEKHGVLIVRPEQLTLANQIELFNTSPLIMGMIGSAFHTELFSTRGAELRMVVLSWNKINNRYPMIDSVVESNVNYVFSSEIKSKNDDDRIVLIDVDVDRSMNAFETAIATL